MESVPLDAITRRAKGAKMKQEANDNALIMRAVNNTRGAFVQYVVEKWIPYDTV